MCYVHKPLILCYLKSSFTQEKLESVWKQWWLGERRAKFDKLIHWNCLIWLEENSLGCILKWHVKSTRKRSIKALAISRIFSNLPTFIHAVILPNSDSLKIIHTVTLPKKSNSESFTRHSFHRSSEFLICKKYIIARIENQIISGTTRTSFIDY